MIRRGLATCAVGGILLISACSGERSEEASGISGVPAAPEEPAGPESTTSSESSVPDTTEPTPATTTPDTTTTTSSTTTTSTTTTTTTTTEPPLPVHNPDCVVEVQPGDSLSSIADELDDVTVDDLQLENEMVRPDVLNVGDYLDICAGNEIDDITGDERVPDLPADSGVIAQQERLNQLFDGTGIGALTVDGDSGPVTRQRLCAARVALGLPTNRNDMAPGSDEEQRLMTAGGLPAPPSAPTGSGRWALVDQTCQVMFVGEGDNVVFVFPASTGEPGHETRDQNASRVFRYRPASDNGGWHNSSDFPAEDDNPLNGNMYRPLYFDRGQAIHGANNVPREPASKGCVRLAVADQDALVGWLGLSDLTGTTSDTGRIGLVVTVQGSF